MTMEEKQELNEYLAERLFGLKSGKDFDYCEQGWLPCGICGYGLELDCKKEGCDFWCGSEQIDFTQNWGNVVEKLLGKCLRVVITHSAYGYDCEIYDSPDNILAYSGCVDGIGEAVCRATYELLKAQEGERNEN